jgi:hypothetical protein
MNIKKRNFHFKREDGCVEFFWQPQTRKQLGTKKRVFWLHYSNTKEQERIWGKNHCNSGYHFAFMIDNVINLDTVHQGKKIFGRINLLQLFNKSFTVMSSGEGVSSC